MKCQQQYYKLCCKINIFNIIKKRIIKKNKLKFILSLNQTLIKKKPEIRFQASVDPEGLEPSTT